MDARLPWSALPTWSLFLPRDHHVTTSSLAPGALAKYMAKRRGPPSQSSSNTPLSRSGSKPLFSGLGVTCHMDSSAVSITKIAKSDFRYTRA
jgi:hypothetical protein